MRQRLYYGIGFILIFIAVFFLIVFLRQNALEKTVDTNPQQTKYFQLKTDQKNTDQINITAATSPHFVIPLNDNKFEKIWKAENVKKTEYVTAGITNMTGDTKLQMQTQFDPTKKQIVIAPMTANKIKPGLYTLSVKVKTYTGKTITVTQDFRWGVLAINTNKGIYQVGDDVSIGMAVLDDLGSTKCKANGPISFGTANVWLTVKSPSGQIQKFATTDDTITGSKECIDRNVTNLPDFATHMTAQEAGTYTIHMEAENLFGKRSIDTTFKVQQEAPDFAIERKTYPMRIYPRVDYPVSITVKANRDYSGTVSEEIPLEFTLSNISDGGTSTNRSTGQTVDWQVDWKNGQTYTLSYTIHFPPVAPEFYLVGPLTVGSFSEDHEWEIASDSIFQLVQEQHNTTTGTSVSAVFTNTPTQNNLVIAICYRTSNNTFNLPSGFSSAYQNSSGPRIYMYYRIAPSGMSKTVSCGTSTSGVIGIQALEYSGNSTSSVRDLRTRRNNISCTGGTFASGSLTPSNPDVLIVSASSSTTSRTVNSHTGGFVDSATSFNPSAGTFDSSWLEAINNPPVSNTDTITYSGNAGTCDNVIVSFNPTISVSQGSYRFFTNNNSVTPGSALAATNTPYVSHLPMQEFRLRVLLDIDSPSGAVISAGSGDWELEYALMPPSNDCSQGTYAPVDTVANGTPIAFNTNAASGGNNVFISSTGSDPSDVGYSTLLEDYIETWLSDGSEDVTNNQNTLSDATAGLFDFSLVDNTSDLNPATYCLIVTNGDGSLLDAYRNYPQIQLANSSVRIVGKTKILGGTKIF